MKETMQSFELTMKKLFDYLFYRAYYFFNKLYGKNDNPFATAWLFISFLLFFAVIAILNFFPAVSRPILMFKEGVFFLVLGIVNLAVFYFLFMFRKRYVRIISKYSIKSKPSIITVLLPIILFVGVGALYVLSLVY